MAKHRRDVSGGRGQHLIRSTLLVLFLLVWHNAVFAESVSDDFSSGDFTGGTNGTNLSWSGDWTRSSTTDVTVVSGQARLQGSNASLYRSVDLSDALSGSISLDYGNGNFDSNTISGQAITIEVCSDTAFTNCQMLFSGETLFKGETGQSGTISAVAIQDEILTATATLRVTANTKKSFFGSLPYYTVDNVNITADVVLPGEISGTVFHDYDASGTGTSDEPGLAGIIVTATDASGNAFSAITDANGDYSITAAASGLSGEVRLEFTLPNDGSLDFLQPGAAGGSSVQFADIDVGASVKVGFNNPNDYCQANPLLCTSLYVNGDASSTQPAMFSLQYNGASEQTIATQSQIGATWGLAYQGATKQLYASAVVRRHSGLGSLGLGGIYTLDPVSGTVNNFIDLEAAPFNIDFGTLPSNAARNLPASVTQFNADPLAFGAVGKQGLGDIDLSEDGNSLWAVNLYANTSNLASLIKMDVTGGVAPSTATEYPLSAMSGLPSCSGGVLRPWALKFANGKGYLGAVCSAETSGNASDLMGYVLSFDPANPTSVTTELTIPLDYTKGETRIGRYGTDDAVWYPWTDTYSDAGFNRVSDFVTRPTPVLSDIEFDQDGGMILGFLDRGAMQMAYHNQSPTPPTSSNEALVYQMGSELLRACDDGSGTYVLESGGVCGGVTGYSTNNGKGPGGGEYYNDDAINYLDTNGNVLHEETAQGGLALLSGSGEVVITAMDPTGVRTSGFVWLDNATGTQTQHHELSSGSLSDDGRMGKAAAHGDIEILCDAAPLEIGNRVWHDSDGDGIQGPGENSISGVGVQLFDMDNSGQLVGTATTAADGSYYFGGLSDANMSSGMLLSNRNYELRISLAGAALPVNTVTTQNAGGISSNDGLTDLNDSDAVASGGNAVIAFTTGSAGQNNHTLDFGFAAAPCSLDNSVIVTSCNDNGTGADPADDTFSYTINLTGSNTGTGYNISGGDVHSGLTYGSDQGPLGNFLISGGDISLNLSDFDDSACALTDVTVTAPATCSIPAPVICDAGNNDLGGQVWLDSNMNGTQDLAESGFGAAGMLVTAYDNGNTAVATTNVSNDGSYSFPALAGGDSYRLEVSGLPDYLEFSNTGSGTLFVGGATCAANVAVYAPTSYCQADPKMVVPLYINGNPLAGGTTGSSVSMLSFNYSDSGTGGSGIATQSETGSTWGVAYHRATESLFTSAVLRRHSGLGPDGLGAIYVTDMSTGTPGTSLFVNVSATLGIDVGTVPSNSTRGLPANRNVLNTDPDAFAAVGKVGIGDIDLSEDGTMMFLSNLYDQQIYSLLVSNPLTTPTSSAALPAQPWITSNPCTNGEPRPWGIKSHLGSLYVGVVCDAGSESDSYTTNPPATLTAMVYQHDLASGIWSKVIDFPLNYQKGETSTVRHGSVDRWWQSWTDRYDSAGADRTFLYDNERTSRPMPILADIEFDQSGAMLLGFLDRGGLMIGFDNNSPNGSQINQYNVSGDILRACPDNGGAYVLESGGSCGGVTGGGANAEGLGGGEFYNFDRIDRSSGTLHAETSMGGLAQHPQTGDIAVVSMDPLYNVVDAGGVNWFSRTDGSKTKSLQLFQSSPASGGTTSSGAMGKSNSLGDIELLCDAAPLVVGDRVWLDTDGDGIQDADENGISGIDVTLDCGGTLVTTTTAGDNPATIRDETGSYYFSGEGSGNAAGELISGASCTIAIDTTQSALSSYVLTLENSDGTTANAGDSSNDRFTDVRDSDGVLDGSSAEVSFTAGNAGENNHSFDFGFHEPMEGTITIVKNTDGNDATFNFSSSDSELDAISITTSGGGGSSAVLTKTAGTYAISEDILSGWALDNISISGDTDNGSSSSGSLATLDLDAGEDIVVTFTNSKVITVPPPPGPSAFSCTSDVRLASSVLLNGSSQASGSTSATLDSLLTFGYNETGVLSSPASAVPAGQTGSVWGLGYNAVSRQLYAAAFLKRHVGFGPDGPGAIYAFDSLSATPGAGLLIDLAAAGVDVGSDPRVTTSGVVDDPNELPADATQPSWDQDAFDLVGKMSLGDIDVSADGNTLWAVNLKQRELVEVDVSSGSATVTNQHAIPDPGCSNGDFRPWAVKVHDNRIWLGMVCSAETSQDVNDLRAHIVAFDGTDFVPVYSFSLNYPKGSIGNGPGNESWRPWTSVLQTLATDPKFIIYPQPVLSDIEFDVDGSMILGFMDRTGHQAGGNNYRPDPNDTTTTYIQTQSGGDILRVCNNSGVYELENNATCSGVDTAGKDAGQGPGGGEFYWGEVWNYNEWNSDGGYHKETSFGGLAFRAGSGEIALTAMNPDINANAGGVIWLDNTTGARTANTGLELYQGNESSHYFGKAAGMGDLELFCADPLPCSLNTPNIVTSCNDNGTGADPSDDTFGYTINLTGSNTGANYNISGDDVHSGLTYASDEGPLGNFLISGGSVTLNVTDFDNAACTLTGITVTAPASCSDKIDLELTKTADKTNANRGETVIYTLTVSNTSANDATGVQVSDVLPAGVTYASDDGAGDYDSSTGVWSIEDLGAGQNTVLNITVTVD